MNCSNFRYMNRYPYPRLLLMKNDLLPALRKELENSFGRKVLSSRDCLQMVDDIYQKTGYTINTNTLRRFFGLVKTDYNASPSTLSILLKYCGFNSIEELRKKFTPLVIPILPSIRKKCIISWYRCSKTWILKTIIMR